MSKFQDLTGQKFGRLTVVSLKHKQYRREDGCVVKTTWNCACDCGGTKPVTSSNLVTGHTRSCGCLSDESRGVAATKHGKSGHTLFITWLGIKARCYNPKSTSYKTYGAVGVGMFEPWIKDFEAFYTYVVSELGDRPTPKHSLDRVDGELNYEPGNIRWATDEQQSNNRPKYNRHIKFNGVTKTLSIWCKELNLDYMAVYQRLYKLNWPVEKAFQKTNNGFVKT